MYKKLLLTAVAPALIFANTATKSTVNASAAPQQEYESFLPKNNNQPYVELDFLYWSAKQEGNNYAVTGTANTVPGTVNPNTGLISPTITSTGKVYSFKPTAKPGFKLTFGMNWEYDSWELFANYSYLHGSQHSSVASNSVNTGIIPLLSYAPNNSVLASSVFYTPGGAVGFVSEAKASWSFFYNNINLELAKSIPLFSYFVLHPHFGFQASWQKQHFHASYYVSSLINSATNLGNNQAIFSQKFWGIGPRVGFDSLWQCCNHLGFFANTAFSLLYGKFHGKSTSYDTNVTAGYTHVLIAKNIYKPTTLSPVLELNLGAASEWMLYNKYLLVAHVSWDTQAWLFQNQHSTSVPDPTLLFQGLNAGIRFNF